MTQAVAYSPHLRILSAHNNLMFRKQRIHCASQTRALHHAAARQSLKTTHVPAVPTQPLRCSALNGPLKVHAQAHCWAVYLGCHQSLQAAVVRHRAVASHTRLCRQATIGRKRTLPRSSPKGSLPAHRLGDVCLRTHVIQFVIIVMSCGDQRVADRHSTAKGQDACSARVGLAMQL